MKYWIVICLFFFHTTLFAQLLPDDRIYDWHYAGMQYPVIYETHFNITDFGAIADDNLPDDQAFYNAFQQLTDQSGTLFIPQGIFILEHSLELPDNIIIKGSGVDLTTLEFHHDEIGIQFVGQAGVDFFNVSNAYKGNRHLICSKASLLNAGDFIELIQTNGDWDTHPASWAENSIGQIIEVVQSKEDTLFLRDPLTYSYDSLLQPRLRKISPRKNCGIECIKLKRKSNNSDATAYGILFQYATHCEIKNIESDTSQASHVMINASSHIYIHSSYFHHAYDYSGSATKGYGITLNNHACFCLIENNIFNHLRHSMMTKNGANVNVFGYNFSINPYRNGENEFPPDFCGDISLHGHYSFGNLFEGNIIQNIIIDDYWGPSGSFNTFFRNRVENYGFIMTSPETHKTNIIANEITGIGYSFPFNLGMFILSGNNNLCIGNCIQGSFSNDTSQINGFSSFYRTTTPFFWNYNCSWPNIGYPLPMGSSSIPSETRYVLGQPVSCTDSTWIQSISKNNIKHKIYPNPTESIITIESNEKIHRIIILSIDGKKIKEISVPLLSVVEINISDINSGTYFIIINNSTQTFGVNH